MKKGKYLGRKGMSKVLVLVLALVLVVGGAVGGTLAWLTDNTDPLTNTFTPSDIDITLSESEDLNLQMIPGHTITKDPKVTVLEGSEECWLFVEIEKSTNFDDYMTYEIAEGWKLVANTTDVYARKVETANIGTAYSVLKGDKVMVKESVTKQMMDELIVDDLATGDVNESTYPTLTFTAYASQLMKDADTEFTAVQAWANVAPSAGTPGN